MKVGNRGVLGTESDGAREQCGTTCVALHRMQRPRANAVEQVRVEAVGALDQRLEWLLRQWRSRRSAHGL